MKAFLLVCLAHLACACTPHEVRCGGPLEPINASAAKPGAVARGNADSSTSVP